VDLRNSQEIQAFTRTSGVLFFALYYSVQVVHHLLRVIIVVSTLKL